MYLGLTRAQAIECLDFVKAPNAKTEPTVLEDTDFVKTESLINKNNTDCFIVNRITLSGSKKHFR